MSYQVKFQMYFFLNFFEYDVTAGWLYSFFGINSSDDSAKIIVIIGYCGMFVFNCVHDGLGLLFFSIRPELHIYSSILSKRKELL